MKIQESRKIFVLFYMLGFLLGIVYANLASKDYIASTGIFSDFFLEQYASTDMDTGGFLGYVTYTRFFPVALVAAFCGTRFRKSAAVLFLLWTGCLSGLLLTAAVMKLGVKGIILCLISLFPQFLCYVPAYLLLLWFLFHYPQNRWNGQKTVCFGLLMVMGILLECHVNPVIVKLFLRTL